VILALMATLAGCSGVRARLVSLFHASPGAQSAQRAATTLAPKPAEGLWAILDPGCAKPSAANFGHWPRCASPFWISRGRAVVMRSQAAPDGAAQPRSYRTDYRLAAGDPVIAQIGDDRSGYLYLALTELARNAQGRLIAAAGLPFACPKPGDGAIKLAPNVNGCESQSPATIRKLAFDTLQDHAGLSRVAWIAPGAP
jgi:hypothetical protein